MTPTETTTILRQFNEWRRGDDETIEHPDPREIGEAIDAAGVPFEVQCRVLCGVTKEIAA